MATTVSLSATLNDGESTSVAMTYSAEHLHSRKFELASGAVMELAFQSAIEGTAIKFLFLESVLTSNTSVHTEVSFGVSDAEASAPASGTNWHAVNGVLISRESISLSSNNKLYIYNSGGNRSTVTIKVGLDGA